MILVLQEIGVELESVVASTRISSSSKSSSSSSSSSLTLSSFDIFSKEDGSFMAVDAWKAPLYGNLSFQWLGCGSEAPSVGLQWK